MINFYELEFRKFLTFQPLGSTYCESMGCLDDGICRCYTVEDLDLIRVNVNEMSKIIHGLIYNDEVWKKRLNKISNIIFGYEVVKMDEYMINRILTNHKVWVKEKWDWDVDRTYYGEHISRVYLREDVKDDIFRDIKYSMGLETLKEKTIFLMEKEYGGVLDIIQDREEYNIIEVDINDLVFPDKNHLQLVINKDKTHYKSYSGIFGIAYLSGGKWVVLDGYHRLTSKLDGKVKIIGIS